LASVQPSGWSRIARRIRVPLGFVFALLYFCLAKPTWISIASGAAIAAVGVAIRAAAAGHVKKNRELTTTGPYGYTRNPLYLGSMIIALGFGIASRNWWVAVAIVALFLAIYLPVIRSEEEFLRSEFPGFDEYCTHVPRLIPRVRASGETANGSFSKELYLRHREYNATIGAITMLAALAVKLVFYSR
jgi:protein-S-isoprenylcysteine O-methyltransferase Ste14